MCALMQKNQKNPNNNHSLCVMLYTEKQQFTHLSIHNYTSTHKNKRLET